MSSRHLPAYFEAPELRKRPYESERDHLLRLYNLLKELKREVEAGEPLTDEDQKILKRLKNFAPEAQLIYGMPLGQAVQKTDEELEAARKQNMRIFNARKTAPLEKTPTRTEVRSVTTINKSHELLGKKLP